MNRHRLQKRKQIIFLVAIVLILLVAGGFLIGRYTSGNISTGFRANIEEDTILYEGKEYRYNDHLSNYLFLGIDTREKVETYESRVDAGQADAIFLVSYDRAEKTLQGLIIPRDTITEIQTFSPDGTPLGTSRDHINVQYAYGDAKDKSCELMQSTVSALLYDTPIQGYCSMNMDGIPIVTDIIDGVKVTVPNASLEKVNPEFAEGATVMITGENAEQFVRYRDIEVEQSAITRTERQKVYIKAFAEKAQQLYTQDAGIVSELYEGVQDYMITNMGNDLFVKLLEASSGAEPQIYTLPGEAGNDGYFDIYEVDDSALFEMILQMFYKEV